MEAFARLLHSGRGGEVDEVVLVGRLFGGFTRVPLFRSIGWRRRERL